ncbi:MAG: glycosyltransferase family 39 protein [Bacteroidota bacterium]
MSKSRTQIIIVICATILVLFANLWGYPLYILDEVKNAQCAKEMMLSEDYITPTFNGKMRTDKPPLHYYFMVLSYKVFGFSAFAARFFSAFFGVLTVLLTFLISRKYVGERGSKVASVVMVASIGIAFQFHMATPDAFLVFFMTSSLFSYFHYFKSGKKLFLYLTYVAMALASLTKGPVGIVLPAVSIFFFLIAKKQLKKKTIKAMHLGKGALIILLLSAPWYGAVFWATDGAWTSEFFLFHNFGRYTSSKIGHGSAFYLPTIFIVAWALPFSAFLIQSLHKPFKYRLNDLAIMSLVTFTVTIAFFSLSSNKLIHYVSPTLPFVAIMTGNFLGAVNSENWKSSKMNFSIYFLVALCILIPLSAILAIYQTAILAPVKEYSFIFLTLPLGAIMMIFFLLKRSLRGVVITMATVFILTTNLMFYLLVPKIIRLNPVKESVAVLEKAERVATYRKFNSAFVLEFEDKLLGLDNQQELDSFFADYPKGMVITRDKYLKEHRLEDFYKVIYQKSDLIDEHQTVILAKKD